MVVRLITQAKVVAKISTIVVLAVALSPSCSTVRKTGTAIARSLKIIDEPRFTMPQLRPKQMPEEYRLALSQLEDEKYQEALNTIDSYLRDEPADPYTQAMTLTSGRALEGLNKWSEASARYRSVITATEKIAPKLQAMTLYRLSFCHEAVGDDQQTVAVLHDLLSRAKFLPEEIAQAELPARLAAAYARVGNFEKAVEHYRRAEIGITKLKRERDEESLPEWLPRTLYYMGSMSLRRVTWDDFEAAIRPLARAQTYLLQSAELGMRPWSDRAANDLIATYTDLWNTIERAPVGGGSDPVVEKRTIEERQVDRATLVLETLHELRARAVPQEEKPSSPQEKQIVAFLLDLDKKINTKLAQRPTGDGLTVEAKERRKMVRGRVVDPSNVLERKFLESSKETKPPTLPPRSTLPSTQEAPPTELPEKIRTKDPNL